MAIIVDTNIILDVLTDHPKWAEWSIDKLDEYFENGLIITPAVYAELCFGYDQVSEVDQLVRDFGLLYKETNRIGLFYAAKAFKNYKSKGGGKDFVLPDFFIGGHAQATGLSILTRDIQRYKTYFPKVQLVTP